MLYLFLDETSDGMDDWPLCESEVVFMEQLTLLLLLFLVVSIKDLIKYIKK